MSNPASLADLPGKLVLPILEYAAHVSLDTLLISSQLTPLFRTIYKSKENQLLSACAQNEIPSELRPISLFLGNIEPAILGHVEGSQPWRAAQTEDDYRLQESFLFEKTKGAIKEHWNNLKAGAIPNQWVKALKTYVALQQMAKDCADFYYNQNGDLTYFGDEKHDNIPATYLPVLVDYALGTTYPSAHKYYRMAFDLEDLSHEMVPQLYWDYNSMAMQGIQEHIMVELKALILEGGQATTRYLNRIWEEAVWPGDP